MNKRNPFRITHEVELDEQQKMFRVRKSGQRWGNWHSFHITNEIFINHMLKNEVWGSRWGERYRRIK